MKTGKCGQKIQTISTDHYPFFLLADIWGIIRQIYLLVLHTTCYGLFLMFSVLFWLHALLHLLCFSSVSSDFFPSVFFPSVFPFITLLVIFPPHSPHLCVFIFSLCSPCSPCQFVCDILRNVPCYYASLSFPDIPSWSVILRVSQFGMFWFLFSRFDLNSVFSLHFVFWAFLVATLYFVWFTCVSRIPWCLY